MGDLPICNFHVHSEGGLGIKDCAHCEIEALQARVEELDKECEAHALANVQQSEENESLEKQLDRATAHVGELELEQQTGRTITDEQIDAAWKKRRSDPLTGSKISGVLLPASELGIFRCEHLGASQINGELTEPCPDCNGHGWVIGGEDEP